MQPENQPRIAVYHEHLHGGGATQVVLHVIRGLLAKGYTVDLVVNNADGGYRDRVPPAVHVEALSQASQERTRWYMLRAAAGNPRLFVRSLFVARKELDKLLYLPSLVRYLRRRRPLLLISNLWQLALTALSACSLAPSTTRVVCVFHSAYFHGCAERLAKANRPAKWRHFLEYCARTYALADALICVSQGIADDLVHVLGLSPTKMQTIYNPVIDTEQAFVQSSIPDHPWLGSGRDIPVLVAVGRLSPEKNYAELIEAIAMLRRRRPVRLIILGEGSCRVGTEALIKRHGLGKDVDLPGWTDDPASYLCCADLFVLTSRTEGLSLVLIEALACGCPSVAYNCPHGPKEILEHGRYGQLVPLGNVRALADAMDRALSDPPDRRQLIERGRAFAIKPSVARYVTLVEELLEADVGLHGAQGETDRCGR